MTNQTDASFPIAVPASWDGVFARDYSRIQFTSLVHKLEETYLAETIHPPKPLIFRALELVRPQDVKVVIVGQDPYPTPGNAHGLAFSVNPPSKPPPSLRTIFKELERSIPGWKRPSGGNLEPWTHQGVLLLNTILTVNSGKPMSHAGFGWERFTRAVLDCVQRETDFVIFLLWGSKAQATVRPLIDNDKHMILESSHPSPMAQNTLPIEKRFVGNNHFAEANRLLVLRGRTPIDWAL